METTVRSLLDGALAANAGRVVLPSTATPGWARTRGWTASGGAQPVTVLDQTGAVEAGWQHPAWSGPQPSATRRAVRGGWQLPDGWAGLVFASERTDLDEAIRVLAIGGLLVWLGDERPRWPDGVEVAPVPAAEPEPELWRREGAIMPGSRNCVVCGRDNAVGLGLRFSRSGHRVFTRARPPAHFEGFDGVLHGGIVAAMMDDALWYSIHAATGMIGMTVDLQVRYRRPVPMGEELTVAGRFAGRRRTIAEASARIFDPSGEVLAEATGRFMPGPQALRWDGDGPRA